MFELASGQIVAEKYRIEGILGSGGMGVVVSAVHLELEQRVAIKLLRDASPESVARFQREARLIVRLKSPHVARVFDVGTMDDETPYIVMELLEGEDLSKVLTRRKRIEVSEAVDYVLEACEAIAEAHTLGMVHRDLKPANLFLARGPGGSIVVKVLDFGISKSLDDLSIEGTSGGLTSDGVALGSPGYMSPEQMTSSRDVDERTDIYAIGAMLYRLTTGQNPYTGDSLISILAAMASGPLPPLRSVAPNLPEGFAKVVERCLAQNPEDRYGNVALVANALASFGTRKGQTSAEQIAATIGTTSRSFGKRNRPPSSGALKDDSLGPTIVSPLSAPAVVAPPPHDDTTHPIQDITAPLHSSTPSVLPLPPPPAAQPMYVAPPFERSETALAQRKLRANQTNVLAAIAAVALLSSAIAWVAFHHDTTTTTTTSQSGRELTDPTTIPVPLPPPTTTPTPSPTTILIAPPTTTPAATMTTTASETPTPTAPKPKLPPKPTPHHPTSHGASTAPPSPTSLSGDRH